MTPHGMDRLQRHLRGTRAHQALRSLPIETALRPAAVLVALIDPGEAAEEASILLTVRASGLRRHAGQVSFPGGRIESSDADAATAALREAEEEVGLPVSASQLLGYLPDHAVISGYRVTPVVVRIRSLPPLRPDPAEVQQCFQLPWSRLIDAQYHREVEREVAGQRWQGTDIHYDGHRIWGATASMLMCLRQIALSVE